MRPADEADPDASTSWWWPGSNRKPRRPERRRGSGDRGSPVEQQLLSDYAGWDAGGSPSALREAIDAQVLSVSSRRRAPPFPARAAGRGRGRRHARDRATASHSRWAEVLEAAGPAEPTVRRRPDSDRLQLIAHHYARSGRLDLSAPADLNVARTADRSWPSIRLGSTTTPARRVAVARRPGGPARDHPGGGQPPGRGGGEPVRQRRRRGADHGPRARRRLVDVAPAWVPLLRERRAGTCAVADPSDRPWPATTRRWVSWRACRARRRRRDPYAGAGRVRPPLGLSGQREERSGWPSGHWRSPTNRTSRVRRLPDQCSVRRSSTPGAMATLSTSSGARPSWRRRCARRACWSRPTATTPTPSAASVGSRTASTG